MQATFVSVWDGGIQVRSKCEVENECEVTSIEVSETGENLETCEDQYVEYEVEGELRQIRRKDGLIMPDDKEFVRYVVIKVRGYMAPGTDPADIINGGTYEVLVSEFEEDGTIVETDMLDIVEECPV